MQAELNQGRANGNGRWYVGCVGQAVCGGGRWYGRCGVVVVGWGRGITGGVGTNGREENRGKGNGVAGKIKEGVVRGGKGRHGREG